MLELLRLATRRAIVSSQFKPRGHKRTIAPKYRDRGNHLTGRGGQISLSPGENALGRGLPGNAGAIESVTVNLWQVGPVAALVSVLRPVWQPARRIRGPGDWLYPASRFGWVPASCAVTRHGEGLSVIGAALFDHFLTPGNGVLSVGVRPVREVLNGGRCRCGICPTMRPPYVRD